MLKIAVLLGCCAVVAYNYKNKRLISSSSLWVFCYALIFVVYPLYETNAVFKNEEKIDGLAFLGIVFYYIGLSFGSRLVLKKKKRNQLNKVLLPQLFPQYKIANILFWVFFALSIIVLVAQLGTNGIASILTGRMTAKQFALGSDSNNSMYVFSVHLLVPCVLTLWMTATNKKQKINSVLCLGIYVLETVLFGFTRIFLISIVAMIVVYEIRNVSQNKQAILVLAGIVCLTLIMVSMNFIRTFGLRSDRSLKNIFDIEYIFESTDFGASYDWFDVLLNFKSPYINPVVYLKPVFAFIPRTIWKGKPEPLSMQVLLYVNPAKAATGYSTAGNSVLGEGYAIFGSAGILIFPLLWGTICGKLDKRYYKRLRTGADHCLQNICYYIFAVFIVISGQRGDWCQYMTIVIWFYMLPMYIMSKVSLRLCHD